MFNAPCGVRTSVSERKRSVCFGLCYVWDILSNDCACIYILKKSSLFSALTAAVQVVPECSAAADCSSVVVSLWDFSRGRRTRT